MCGPVVLTVMVANATLAGPAPDRDVEEQVASVGKPVQAKLIAFVKLLEAMMPIAVVPDPPGVVIVTSVGLDTARKPGWIVNVTGAVLLLVVKLPSPL